MRMRLLIAGPLAAVFSLLLAATAMADIGLTVTSTDDNTNVDGQCTLREAIAASNANAATADCPSPETPSENQIDFAAALGANPVINLGPTLHDLSVDTNDVTITGPATVDGALDPGFRVITSAGINLTLNSLTISNGRDTAGNGGGISITGGRLFLNSSSVTGNTVTVTTASGFIQAQGGGIFSNGAPVTLTDSNVSNNQAIASLTGGGTGNVLALGGGMEVSGDDVNLENSVVSDNKALASNDGTGGSLEGDGGGIRTDGGVLIEHSTISGNLGSAIATGTASVAAQGGGLLVHDGPGIDLELSTIANNLVKASGGNSQQTVGGGIGDDVPNSDDNFISDTIVGNGLDPGSATSNVQGLNFQSSNVGTGSRSFSNTIIANPVGSAGTNCQGDTPYATDGPNVDFPQDNTEPCFTPGPGILNVDPQLGALGNNGGATQTMVPSASSPVIDKGTADDQNDLTEDQRGLTRPVVFSGLSHPFDGSDIGAVEVQQTCAGQPTPGVACPSGGGGGGGGAPPTPPPAAGPTGQRAAALKKCKKKKGKAHKKCVKRAKNLPV